mgnify:CR=1 FL=1
MGFHAYSSPYDWSRIAGFKATAKTVPGGMIDLSVARLWTGAEQCPAGAGCRRQGSPQGWRTGRPARRRQARAWRVPRPAFLAALRGGAEEGGEQPRPHTAMASRQHVLKDAHVLKQPDVLERPGDAQFHDLVGGPAGNVLPIEDDLAGVGR